MVFGFNQGGNDYGVMLYHCNRLIKAYEKIGIQKQQNGQGKSVIGVVEVDFLEPIHNKQDFNKTDKYNACMTNLGQKLSDYWNEKTNQGAANNPVQIKADWDWAQCDNCLKWRRLPDGVDHSDLPEKWFCFLNQDATHNRCDVEEEPEDEDWVLNGARGASYQKIYKKQMGKEKVKKRMTIEQEKRELEEERKWREEEKWTNYKKLKNESHNGVEKGDDNKNWKTNKWWSDHEETKYKADDAAHDKNWTKTKWSTGKEWSTSKEWSTNEWK